MHHHQFASLLAFLVVVRDPRKARGKRYRWELLLAVICGALLSGYYGGSATAQRIIDQGGDYLMVVKKNQPTLYEDRCQMHKGNAPDMAQRRL